MDLIAALFVEKNGIYSTLANVEVWDKEKDARLYMGTRPVVAHPPCERWGRYWSGGPSAKTRRDLGDDNGCFASALAAVRRCGGVLEHPEASHAWRAFGLFTPPKGGGWIVADSVGGWTCCVEQGHYGHRARKASWLYACGVELPSLCWGRSGAKVKPGQGLHTKEERTLIYQPKNLTKDRREQRKEWLQSVFEATGKEYCCPERMGKRERLASPAEFAALLVSIARTAKTA